jgi:molybdopterin-guanine dinucleotide biosynthesis protein A
MTTQRGAESALVTVAVLAGGQSRRMGTDKSFVLLDGQPIIQHVIARVRALRLPVILIANDAARYGGLGLPLYGDVFPGSGSLGGVYSALHHSGAPYTLCVGCDMPLLAPALLRFLIDQRHGYDIVVPMVGGRPESLHAVYSQRCLPVMRQQIEQQQLKINRVHDLMHTLRLEEAALRPFDPALRSFMNINTPDDLARIRQHLSTDKG